mmetsp:Transcript_38557/g.110728  ORF Transcript_38557/g.110728 Transcript_38557/m.110728 type:complete len:219 (-) Transcript_38557:472-1128(-)
MVYSGLIVRIFDGGHFCIQVAPPELKQGEKDAPADQQIYGILLMITMGIIGRMGDEPEQHGHAHGAEEENDEGPNLVRRKQLEDLALVLAVPFSAHDVVRHVRDDATSGLLSLVSRHVRNKVSRSARPLGRAHPAGGPGIAHRLELVAVLVGKLASIMGKCGAHRARRENEVQHGRHTGRAPCEVFHPWGVLLVRKAAALVIIDAHIHQWQQGCAEHQ